MDSSSSVSVNDLECVKLFIKTAYKSFMRNSRLAILVYGGKNVNLIKSLEVKFSDYTMDNLIDLIHYYGGKSNLSNALDIVRGMIDKDNPKASSVIVLTSGKVQKQYSLSSVVMSLKEVSKITFVIFNENQNTINEFEKLLPEGVISISGAENLPDVFDKVHQRVLRSKGESFFFHF